MPQTVKNNVSQPTKKLFFSLKYLIMMLIANTLAITLRCAFDGITANECGQFFTSHQSLLSGILSIVFCVQIPLTAPPIILLFLNP